MTDFEKKAEELRQSAEQAQNEAAAAKAEAAAVKAEAEAMKGELAKKDTELKEAQNNINNLDASVKEQAASIKDLKAALKGAKSVDFKTAMRNALEEKRADMQKMFDSNAKSFEMTVELKDAAAIGTLTNITPNNFLGVAVDPVSYAAAPVANAFIMAFGIRPRTANKLGWIESTNQPVVDYVAELAQNTNLSDVDFYEKQRAFGKLATKMQISTEFEDWFEQLYNFCVNEGVRMIENKLDAEIAKGAGVDVTYPNKIYGLVSQATAFDALAHGVTAPNIADVVMDAAAQIAMKGFSANAVFMTWADYRKLESLKDNNGNYIYDRARGMMGGIRVWQTSRLNAGELLVADTNAAEIYAGNSYELEFIRNGAYDAYDVYFRRAAQVKVTTPNAKGLIYVASVASAISALGSNGSGSGSADSI